MAEPFTRRTNTSSTIDADTLLRDNEDATQKTPLTPVRTKIGGRRGTLSHRKLVFCDPVAFRYLEEDESTIVLARRERLQGFELYAVEQWVCSRVHPTFVITTYTGDPAHSILVNVLAVPSDEKIWSRRLKIYFDAVSQFHAREQETSLGTLMVTNLSAFPSALSVISVPDGDIKKHREDFIVNENLKRMGCSGRAAMTLQPAPPGTVAKFQHLYLTSESIPFKTSVMELVRLCQTALALYGKLNLDYADGLLCDLTENAVHDWWNDIGTDFHNVEPSDGVLGPTTVSALVGLMIGAYNRIRVTGISVPKDVLDVPSLKRAIGHFQKSQKMSKTRRLDRDTLDRLHRVTAKSANSEGGAVTRVVKSTVAELSGKGGEMVMGAIGANKDKIAISEIETLDIDKLAQLCPGAKMKWLWHGKPLKTSRAGIFNANDDGLNGKVFSTDDQGNYIWTSEARDSIVDQDDYDEAPSHDKSRVRRIGGAVGIPGIRAHKSRFHRHNEDHAAKEDVLDEFRTANASRDLTKADFVSRSPTSFYGRESLDQAEPPRLTVGLALARADAKSPATKSQLQAVRDRSDSGRSTYSAQLRGLTQAGSDQGGQKRTRAALKSYHDQIQGDQYQNFATEFDEREPATTSLRHSKSALMLREIETPVAHNLRLPRQMSFSLVEDSVLQFPPAQDKASNRTTGDVEDGLSLPLRLHSQEVRECELKQLAAQILDIEQKLMIYAEGEVFQVQELDQESRDHLAELNDIYYERLDEYQSLQATSRDLVAREKASFSDGLRRIEMLGQKLDYELDALQSRMQEVEDGVVDFERHVLEMEARVTELVHERRSMVSEQIERVEDKSIPWIQRAINFFGSSKK